MWSVLVWWLAIEVIGLLALPITFALLRFLPDRGVGVSRAVGLLLSAYAYWLLVSLGFLHNTRASIVAVLLGLGACSFAVWRRCAVDLGAFLRRARRTWLWSEAIFFLCLVGFSLFRAYDPNIAATEKPMEFAFLNGILRSEAFPPSDPWLSGFGISYYYFGYVMVAMVTRLTGLASGVTFNLAGATLLAMTFVGAYSLVSNMVEAHRRRGKVSGVSAGSSVTMAGVSTGLLGGVLVALIGNLEGVFELVRARGWGSEALWQFLDVRNLQSTARSATWYPDDMWWWWRASRVVHDRDLFGNSMEVIDEFPFFSFLLGDNHPHVLALPFVLLALALALNLLLRPARELGTATVAGVEAPWWSRLTYGIWSGWPLDVPLWGLLLGALGFLNTWDYPTCLGLFALAYFAWRVRTHQGSVWTCLVDTVALGVTLGVLGLLFYLPFYLGFRSQAGGVGLVLGIKTQVQQYVLMFGTQLVLVGGFLAAVGRRRISGGQRPSAASLIVGLVALLAVGACLTFRWWTASVGLFLAGLAGVLLLWSPGVGNGGRTVVSMEGGGSIAGEVAPRSLSAAEVLCLLALMAGLLLTALVEFIYLRDTFNTRMNTVFKFYYQAWVLLSVVGAFGVYEVLSGWHKSRVIGRILCAGWAVVGVALLLAGLSYTVMGIVSKAGGFQGTPTLDGTAYVREYHPDEYEAISWLQANAPRGSVMVEAPGNQYSEYNRVSAHTGIPTLLGWGGHELQWRGNYDEPGRREADIAVIYQPDDVAATADILTRYGVDYVYVGPNERAKYGVSTATLQKLAQIMEPVFENGQVIIYGYD